MTKLCAVIGYPIGHSMSPAIYNAAFAAMGLDVRHEAWAVQLDEIPAALERLRGDEMLGMNVTVPNKQAVMPLLDEIDPMATAIGAVNCISKQNGRLIGHNTDMYGFIRSLREAGCNPKGMRVAILGVGGSARAVAYGLIEAGAASLTLAGRTQAHVDELAEALHRTQPQAMVARAGWQDAAFEVACREAGLIVNCTPIGMRDTPLERESALPAPLHRPGLWVCDLVYNPLETRLLADARAAGGRPVGGLEMLLYQGVESVRHWTGREAPVDIMRKAAQEAMAARER